MEKKADREVGFFNAAGPEVPASSAYFRPYHAVVVELSGRRRE